MGTSLSIKLTLRRDNVTLPSRISKLNEYVISTSMLLHNVTQSDAGEYSCQLWDFVGSDVSTGVLIVYKGIVIATTFLI